MFFAVQRRYRGLTAVVGILLAASVRANEPAVEIVPESEQSIEVTLGEPVVIAVSMVGERRWGHHQFPKISPLPGGQILVTYNATADDNAAYGHPGPAYVSRDLGRTWSPYAGAAKALAISHSPVTAIAAGEFFCVPFPVGLDVRKLDGMPEPVGKYFCYADRFYYRLDACPAKVRDYAAGIEGFRWTPATNEWRAERVGFELKDALVWTSEQANGSILSRTSFEYPLTVSRGELLVAEYKFRYAARDGSIPKGMVVTCLASKDNGRTFARRGVIAYDLDGKEHPSETALEETSDGRLVCVGRATCEKTRPLWVTFSKDRGHTWTPTRELFSFGVLPSLLRLKNGVLVLSFGRPGVNFSFSADGTGRTWTQRRVLVKDSCGYTGMVALGDDSFLIAYSRFDHKDEAGMTRKAILVREVKIRRK